MKHDIIFAQGHPSVIIPTKRDEDMGYDIYANFDLDYMVLPPHQIVLVPTRLHSAFSKDLGIILKERGSTGTKGMAVRSGVIDSGFRGAWFVPLNNTTNHAIIIAKKGVTFETTIVDSELVLIDQNGLVVCKAKDNVVYPYEKAICQAVVQYVPPTQVKTMTVEELLAVESERGLGQEGSSNK